MTKTFRKVKIFGERNTSTNAVKKLVLANSSSRVLPSVVKELPAKPDLNISMMPPNNQVRAQEAFIDAMFEERRPRQAWKHTATNFDDVSDFEDVFTIIMVRDPASWILALQRRPYHRLQRMPDDLAAFANHDWQTVARDRLNRAVLTPANLWNAKVSAYLGFLEKLQASGCAHTVVRFEDFAVDQAAVFEKLRPFLPDVPETVTLIEGSTKDSDKDRDYYRRYYGEKQWLDKVDTNAREAINAAIDWEVAGKFGYAPH